MVQLSLNFLKNSYLFSTHYLETLIQQNPEWEENEATKEAFNQIKQIYENKKGALKFYNESQLEELFIRPIFKVLGHHYGVQAKVNRSARTPDYGFFPDEDALLEALKNQGKDDFYIKAVAIGDAKSLKVSLDKKRKGKASFEYQNPSFQIDTYLRETPPKWGILTNGRYWRLYNQETSYKLDNYYEIDLFQLLEADDVENFKYFYLFFRLEAFLIGPDGKNFLDRVYEGSITYARELGESLQENVYKAMKILAEGFFDTPKNNLTKTDENIKLVHENTLKLLYRLLFIFYAESRGLLDTSNKAYEYFSLDWIKRDVADRMDKKEPIMQISTVYWDRLKNLFGLINVGSESRGIPKDTLYIPPYNGGLFDPERNHFLEENIVGDAFIAEAVDLLARSKGNNSRGKGFVDYTTLEIRHLGSIYEGLLEYKLKVAEHEMVAIKEKGKEKWILKADANGKKVLDSVKPGELYLVTDKGERKATGSYYTPDYIVKYIIENTLGPIVEMKKEEWTKKMDHPFMDDLLEIKVLDPAMGSGHFLVEATDYLSHWLVRAWAEARPEESEQEEVEEHDIHWARREVVRRCIYGADLNPMAVELAKLSLWLETVAANKPLSFLDHHLKCGNSLIGGNVKDLVVLPDVKGKRKVKTEGQEQPPLFRFVVKQHFDELIRHYGEIAGMVDDELAVVKEKQEKYEALQKSTLNKRFHQLANIWSSTYFGNEVPEDEYAEMQNHLQDDEETWNKYAEQEWFKRAQEIADEKRFYHWELEFPEIFYGEGQRKENPGFDAVVGNPPYGSKKMLNNMEKSFIKIRHRFTGSNDTAEMFIEKAFNLLKNDGGFGYIVPKPMSYITSWSEIRRFLSKRRIIAIGDVSRAFPEVLLEQIIIVAMNKPKTKVAQIAVADEKVIKDVGIVCTDFFTERIFPLYMFDPYCRIYERLEQTSQHLKSLFRVWAGIGGITSKLSRNPKQFLILKGQSVTRYGITDDIWHVSKGVPNINDFKEHAEPRVVCQDIVAHVTTPYDHIILMGTYVNPNILTQETTINFSKKNKGDLISLYFLLSLINSKLFSWHAYYFIFNKAIRTMHYRPGYADYSPIRRISFATPKKEREKLVTDLKERYRERKIEDILDIVEACLPKDEGGNFIIDKEKSDVIHDFLAFLAEQRIEMNKEKQVEIKGFLGWLEREIGASIDDLKLKTKIKVYYGHDFDTLLDVLKQNKKKIQLDPSRRGFQEKVRAEFETSISKLKPLMVRIEKTDWLIDQIVYKLYGLTEEEIKIIEKEK